MQVTDIIRYRNIAQARHSATTVIKSGWLGFFRTSTPATATVDLQAEKRRLMELMASDDDFNSIDSRTTVDLEGSIQMSLVVIKVCDDLTRPPLLHLQCTGIDLQTSRRPMAHAYRFAVSLARFNVLARNSLDQLDALCSPISEGGEKFFDCVVETNPLPKPETPQVDLDICLTTEALRFDIHLSRLLPILACFKAPDNVVTAAAIMMNEQMQHWSKLSKTGLRHVIETRKV